MLMNGVHGSQCARHRGVICCNSVGQVLLNLLMAAPLDPPDESVLDLINEELEAEAYPDDPFGVGSRWEGVGKRTMLH